MDYICNTRVQTSHGGLTLTGLEVMVDVLNGVIMFLAMDHGIQSYVCSITWQLFVYTHMHMASVILVEANLDKVVCPGYHLRGVADHGELVNAYGFSLIIKKYISTLAYCRK